MHFLLSQFEFFRRKKGGSWVKVEYLWIGFSIEYWVEEKRFLYLSSILELEEWF